MSSRKRKSADSDDDLTLNSNGIDDILEVVMKDPLDSGMDPFANSSLNPEILDLDSSSDEDLSDSERSNGKSKRSNEKQKSPSPAPPPKKVPKAVKRTSSFAKKSTSGDKSHRSNRVEPEKSPGFVKPSQSIAKNWPKPNEAIQKRLKPIQPSSSQPANIGNRNIIIKKVQQEIFNSRENKRKQSFTNPPQRELASKNPNLVQKIVKPRYGQNVQKFGGLVGSSQDNAAMNQKDYFMYSGQEKVIRKLNLDGKLEEFLVKYFDSEEDFLSFKSNSSNSNQYQQYSFLR
jgi:hypothetical protein